MPEVIAVTSVIGILAAIAVPSWQSYHERAMLSAGQDKVLQIIRQAQANANLHGVKWQGSFREVDGRVQGALHPADAFPQEIVWESLPKGIHIDTVRSSLYQKNGVYRVQFDHQGNTSGQLGRLTLMGKEQNRLRTCVMTSTILGTVRVDREVKAKDKGCSPTKMPK